jgi:hypothetical protein
VKRDGSRNATKPTTDVAVGSRVDGALAKELSDVLQHWSGAVTCHHKRMCDSPYSESAPHFESGHRSGAPSPERIAQGCEPLLLDLRWADVVPVALAH